MTADQSQLLFMSVFFFLGAIVVAGIIWVGVVRMWERNLLQQRGWRFVDGLWENPKTGARFTQQAAMRVMSRRKL